LPALVADKQRRVRHLIARHLRSTPQVEAFLRWACPRFRLALVTSGSRITVEHALKKVGYGKWFDPIVCAEDVSSAKPAPDGFLKALQLTGFGAAEALVFEDSAAGFQAASAAGLSYVDARTFDWAFVTR
jgi:HAD superfamily hydrolase (TIGR01509 family)